jgi:lysophospholipase L1-like esterase
VSGEADAAESERIADFVRYSTNLPTYLQATRATTFQSSQSRARGEVSAAIRQSFGSKVLERITVGILVLAAIALSAAAVIRTSWIRTKIAALSAPPLADYVEANSRLPLRGQKLRVVLIGDSRIARWPTSAMSDRVEVINRGIGGETLAQMARRFQRDAVSLKPDVIVIQSGGNDLVAATFMDDVTGHAVVRQLAETLLQLTEEGTASGAQVLLTTIIPAARPEFLRLPVWNESLRSEVAEVNGELRRSALPDHARLIDLSAALAGGDDRLLPDVFRLDAVHLNQAGYDRLTELLLRSLPSLSSARREAR